MSWTQPGGAGHWIQHYIVTYWPVSHMRSNCPLAGGSQKEFTVPSKCINATLEKLHPYTVYAVTIRAVTRTDSGLLDPDRLHTNASFSTYPAAPSSWPTNLRHSLSMPGVDVLSWSGIPCHDVNAESVSYYLELDSPDPRKIEQSEWNTTYEFNMCVDLAHFTTYRARLFAQNLRGRSLGFASIDFTTSASAPPKPTELLGFNATESSITLSWKAPYPSHGVMETYKIKFWGERNLDRHTEMDISEEDFQRSNCSLENPCYTIENLRPGTTYTFAVKAKNRGTSYSDYSAKIEIATKELEPPQEIRCTKRAEHDLTINWSLPDTVNGKSAIYVVKYTAVNCSDRSLTKIGSEASIMIEDRSVKETQLTGLSPGCTYMVCVQISVADSYSKPSCANFSTKLSVLLLDQAPIVNGLHGSTVSVTLSPVDTEKILLTAYYLIVVRGERKFELPVSLLNYSAAEDAGLGYYVAATFAPSEMNDQLQYVIGTGDAVGGFENKPLKKNTHYRFALVAESNLTDETWYGYGLTSSILVGESVLTRRGVAGEFFMGAGTSDWFFIGAISFAIIFLILFAIPIACYCRRKKRGREKSESPSAGMSKEHSTTLLEFAEHSDARQPCEKISEEDDRGISTATTSFACTPHLTETLPQIHLLEHIAETQEHSSLQEECTGFDDGSHPSISADDKHESEC
ncbi:uncharacterized protein LOC144109484 [Amblyomma americanum]